MLEATPGRSPSSLEALEPIESRLSWSLSSCWRGGGWRLSSLLLDWLMKFSVLLERLRASSMEGDWICSGWTR
jgi:hypothetical protein